MGEFLQAAFAFPTVVFTTLLGLVLLYWLIGMLGLVDLDLFGSADAIGGAAEQADGVLDSLGGDAADALDGADAGWLDRLRAAGLMQVPITVTFSLLVFFAWCLSLFGVRGLKRFGIVPEGAAELGGAAAAGVIVVALGGGALITLLALNPIRPLFARHDARRRSSFVGSECTIVSQSVDASFGLAEIEDGGAGLRVDVRCSPGHALGRGDRARVTAYDAEAEVFFVAPLDGAGGSSHERSRERDE